MTDESSDSLRLIREADEMLLRHALFGDSSKILAKVLARYRFGLELFAEYLPAVARLAPAIERLDDGAARRLFHDPLVRMKFESAFSDLEARRLASPHPFEAILGAALAALPDALCESRVPVRLRARSEPSKWLWAVAGSSDPYARALQAAFDGIFETEGVFKTDSRGGGGRGTLLNADAASQRRIEEALDLVSTLLPSSGAAALRHVDAIAFLKAKIEGGNVLSAAGGDVTPSTVFLSLEDLGNPWDIAGCLLHEGLHMKLFDAQRSVTLVVAPDETIRVPWSSERWRILRAIYAYHVHVHLALFKAAALCADESVIDRFGSPSAYATKPHAGSVVNNEGVSHFGRSIDRTRYLGEQLLGACSRFLSPQGKSFIGWLAASIAQVEDHVFRESTVAA